MILTGGETRFTTNTPAAEEQLRNRQKWLKHHRYASVWGTNVHRAVPTSHRPILKSGPSGLAFPASPSPSSSHGCCCPHMHWCYQLLIHCSRLNSYNWLSPSTPSCWHSEQAEGQLGKWGVYNGISLQHKQEDEPLVMWSAPAFKYQVQLNASSGRLETARPAGVWMQMSSEPTETTFLWFVVVYWEKPQIYNFQRGRKHKAERRLRAARYPSGWG